MYVYQMVHLGCRENALWHVIDRHMPGISWRYAISPHRLFALIREFFSCSLAREAVPSHSPAVSIDVTIALVISHEAVLFRESCEFHQLHSRSYAVLPSVRIT